MRDEKYDLRDPFGSLTDFLQFMANADYGLPTLQLVNETKGRRYLDFCAYQIAKNINYSELQPKELASLVAIGGVCQLTLVECGEENRHFPKIGFNQGFIDLLTRINPSKPFVTYQLTIFRIKRGDHALKAMNLHGHPVLEGAIEFAISTNTAHSNQWQELWQKLHPTISLPNSTDAWDKIAPEGQKITENMGWKFAESFDSRGDATQEATIKLFGLIDKEMYQKPETLVDAGLRDKLSSYLRTSVWRDLLDKCKHGNRFIKGIPESALDSQRKAQADSEIEEPFLDTLPGPDLGRYDYELEQEEERKEKREIIERAFNQAQLTKMERLVYEKRKSLDLDYDQIASDLSSLFHKNIKTQTVRKHYSNADNKLKQLKPPE